MLLDMLDIGDLVQFWFSSSPLRSSSLYDLYLSIPLPSPKVSTALMHIQARKKQEKSY